MTLLLLKSIGVKPPIAPRLRRTPFRRSRNAIAWIAYYVEVLSREGATIVQHFHNLEKLDFPNNGSIQKTEIQAH